jgi:hypothetical protein
MRRRRQVLQVSTFPFLAVLLCAMGSLILLLLVIDRRAKLAAHARAMQAQQQVASERERDREQRRAELQKQRQQQEEEAHRQEKQLAEKAKAAQKQVAAVRFDLDQEERRYRLMQRQFEALRGRLAQSERDVVAVETEAEKAGAAEKATQQERQRLTEQLALLEAVLANLKDMREREKRTYSLVPYLGKRGQNRKPIYVECQGDAVVFHPDARELKGWDLDETAIRREVEERIDRQRGGPEPPAKGEAPYLFLLVRPAGVSTYYLVQSALLGQKVDFGYEFVDADWVLDFSGKNELPAPWKRVAGPHMKLEPNAKTLPPIEPRSGQVTMGNTQSFAAGSGSGRRAGFFSFPGMDLYLLEKWGGIGGDGIPGVGPFAMARGGPARGTGAIAAPPGVRGTGGSPLFSGQSTEDSPAVPGTGALVGGSAERPGEVVAFRMALGAGSSTPPPPSPGATVSGTTTAGGPAGNSGIAGEGQREIASSISPTENTVTLTPIAPRGNALPIPGDARNLPAKGASNGPDRGGSSKGQAFPGGGNADNVAPPSNTQAAPSGGEVPSGGSGGAAAQGSGQGITGHAPGVGGPGGLPGGDSSSDVPDTPLLAPTNLPGTARGTKAAAAAPALPRIRALNRDWVIPIECQADGVLLIPGRTRFSITALAPTPGKSHPLALTVQQLISRRQATVAVGDPPYRPRLLFQVRSDGLRAYYLAYPLLESLHLPMARENVSARAAPSNRPTIFDQ